MLAIFLTRIAAGQLIYAPVEAQLRIKADFTQESKCSHACLVIYVPSSSKSTWNNVAGGDRTDIVLFLGRPYYMRVSARGDRADTFCHLVRRVYHMQMSRGYVPGNELTRSRYLSH